jgi:hypothetical protein
MNGDIIKNAEGAHCDKSAIQHGVGTWAHPITASNVA